jgi:hypothetical protein
LLKINLYLVERIFHTDAVVFKKISASFPKNISIFSGKFVQKISVRTLCSKGFPTPSGN